MTQTKKKITLKPLSDRILAQRLDQEETLKGGIIIPDTAKKKQETLKVVAIGTGKKKEDGSFEPMPVKVDDKVLMDKYAGQEVTIDNEEYIIAKAEDIIAIIE